jgi:uncharacterized tellurite resistance protein B-like protein
MAENQTTTRFEGNKLVVETGTETEEFEAEFLVAVLLFSIASSDGEISPIEIEKMLQLVADHFELGNSESIEILSSAVESLADNPDLTVILKDLASNLTSSQKEDVAVMMYEVVAADSREDEKELNALAAAAEKIGISPDLLETARQRFTSDK